jgi:hypothetical protein
MKKDKTSGKPKKGLIVLILLVVIGFCTYYFTGFFVIQPIGALPNGGIFWYIRKDVNLPFISSADSILLKENGSINLLGRAIVLGSVLDEIGDRKICMMPYQKWMYKISTNGREFEE